MAAAGAPDRSSVTVLESSISSIEDGVLRYRGVGVEELFAEAGFEDVAWFLWTGTAIDTEGRAEIEAALAAGAALPREVSRLVERMPADAPAIARLQAGLAMLPLTVPDLAEGADLTGPGRAARLLGAVVALTASLQRADNGGARFEPFEGWRGVARTFLAGVCGTEPPSGDVRALEQVLILYADHELNASTFAGRVAASTRADLVSAVLAALSALRGPLHGGVERFVRAMLAAAQEEGAPGVVDRYMRASVPLPGFGHSVYRGPDPRGILMHDLARRLTPDHGHERLLAATEAIEREAARRDLPPANVDLYSVVVYRMLDIPDQLSPLVFATGRMAGWCAHVLEQYERNRLIRPRAAYVGPAPRRWADVPGA